MNCPLQEIKVGPSILPATDAFAGSVYTDVINLADYPTAVFTLIRSAGTGTSLIQIEGCSTAAAAATAFSNGYYKRTTSTSQFGSDTDGAMTALGTAGVNTGATEYQIIRIMVNADQVAADTGYKFVRLRFTEVVDQPVTGCVTHSLFNGRFQNDAMPTAIA